MPLDPNLILQGNPPPQIDVGRAMATGLALQQARQQAQDAAQARQDDQTVRSTLQQSGGNLDDAIQRLYAQGQAPAAMKLEAVRDKRRSDQAKQALDVVNYESKRGELFAKVANGITDQASQDAAINGLDPSLQGPLRQRLGPTFDQAKVTALQQSMTDKQDQLKAAQDGLNHMLNGESDLAAARILGAADTPEKRAGAEAALKRYGGEQYIAMFPDATSAQKYYDDNQKDKPEDKLQSPEVEAIKAWRREHGGAQPTQKDLEQIHRGFKEAGTIVRVTPGNTAGASDAKSIAQAIISGDQPPDMKGLYRFTGPVRAELARQGYNLTKASEDWQSTQKYLSTLNGAQQTRLRQAVEFTRESLPLVQNLVTEWDSAGLPVLSKANLDAAASGAYGSKQQSLAVRLKAQIADLTSELGTVYKGGNSSTDESLKLAAQNLQGNWSKQAALDALKQIDTNLTIRANSIRNTGPIANEGNPYAPQTGGGVPQGVSSLLANKGPGIYTLTDGSKWRKDANGISKVQ